MNNSSKQALTMRLLSLYDEFMSLSPNKKKKADGPINSNLPEFQAVAPNLSALLPDSPDGKFINGEAVIKAYNNYKSVVATISISQDLKTMQTTADGITAVAKELQAACLSALFVVSNQKCKEAVFPEIENLFKTLNITQKNIHTAITTQSPKTSFTLILIPQIGTAIGSNKAIAPDYLDALKAFQAAANAEIKDLQDFYTKATKEINDFNAKGFIKESPNKDGKEIDANIALLNELVASVIGSIEHISSAQLSNKNYSFILSKNPISDFIAVYNTDSGHNINATDFANAYAASLKITIDICKKEHQAKKEAVIKLGLATIKSLISEMEKDAKKEGYKNAIAAARKNLQQLNSPK